MIWSVVLASGTPYLVSIGLSQSLTALTWVAGPLCGIFVQPCMGVLSDRYRSRYGPRRPFIILGAIGTLISMLFLEWIENVIIYTAPIFGLYGQETIKSVAISAAILLVWALNFSIQPLQMGMRAIIVDTFPPA